MSRSGRQFAAILCLAVFSSCGYAAEPAKGRGVDGVPREYTARIVGHAHTDLAWLWSWEETVRDVAPNTFIRTLAELDRMPGLTFAQSQAALYEAMEIYHPEMFERIREKIREGTWIPVGGMWVEPDLNMPDGESLVRQILYGKRYFQDRFGIDVQVGWNPDAFGQSLQIPQILSKSGIGYCVLGRCGPEGMNMFWWEAPDGSRVLGYVPPGSYNVSLQDGVSSLLASAAQSAPVKDFLLLCGVGDHGGGFRPSDLEWISRARTDSTQPRVEFADPTAYFKNLESHGSAFPVVKSELNFIFPGCYTTQIEAKKQNRSCESLLLSAEKFSALTSYCRYRDYYPERDLDEAWKAVLLNQFHDVLAGSGIGPVYDEAARCYEEARIRGERALGFSLETLTNRIDTRGDGIPIIIYNQLFWERTDPVEISVSLPDKPVALKVVDEKGSEIASQVVGEAQRDGAWMFTIVFVAEGVPAFGHKTYRLVKAGAPVRYATSLAAASGLIENEFFKVKIDPATGWITSLRDKVSDKEVLSAPGNVLRAIADEPDPPSGSAWEVSLKPERWDVGQDGARIEAIERGPVRATVRARALFRNSVVEQDIVMYHKIPRVEFHLRLDWQERNLMMKASFPVSVQGGTADFEIPYGYATRPTDGREVPAIRWIDLSDQSAAYGVSLLSDSRYGFDVDGSDMCLSVIRGSTSPDPEADRGKHSLLYALYPHSGTWKEARTCRMGYEVNNPLIARVGMVHAGTLPATSSCIRVEPHNVMVSALKKEAGFDRLGMILRVYETQGVETEATIEIPWPVEIWETDLLERPLRQISTGAKRITLDIKPFEIKTIRIAAQARTDRN